MNRLKPRMPWLSQLLFFLIALNLGWLVSPPSGWSQEEKLPVSARRPVDFSAFGQVRYTDYSSNGTDTFSLRRVRLALASSVLPSLDFKVQIEQTKAISLVEAYLSFHLSRYLEFRAGQYKVPFSYENLKSASEQDFINRSSVVETLCPGRDIGSQGRDIGVTLWLHSATIEAAVGLFNGSGINRLDNDDHKDKAFRFTLSPLRGLIIGGSWYEGLWPENQNASSRLRRRQGLEAQLRSGSLTINGEYICAQNYDQKAAGWVIQVNLLLRQGKIQPVVRFESLDQDRAVKDNEAEAWTVGINFHFAPRTKLQINRESRLLKPETKRQNVYLVQFQIGF